MKELQIVSRAGKWAIGTDGIQWLLVRLSKRANEPVSFVRTSKAILRRCCRENAVPPADIEALLAPLPDYFPGWDAAAEAFADRYSWFIAGKGPRPVWTQKPLVQRPGEP